MEDATADRVEARRMDRCPQLLYAELASSPVQMSFHPGPPLLIVVVHWSYRGSCSDMTASPADMCGGSEAPDRQAGRYTGTLKMTDCTKRPSIQLPYRNLR